MGPEQQLNLSSLQGTHAWQDAGGLHHLII